MSLLAVTGGTGFVGGHLLRHAPEAGHALRALTRRNQPALHQVNWVPGDLGDRDSLARLVEGADAVIHVAGAISAHDREGFRQANVAGTERLVEAAAKAGVRRFVHVSSLAAREPEVSDYGWSKALSEETVRASGLDWTIVRPPAVYGPGDRETLQLFAMARRGLVPLPPAGRLSLIHVRDLVDLLLACLNAPQTIGQLYEPDDGTYKGVSHKDFALALGRAVGSRVRSVSLPGPLVKLGARFDRALRGANAKLTPDRARYFLHPDWVVSDTARPPETVWRPAILMENGLRDTARWYQERGWLR